MSQLRRVVGLAVWVLVASAVAPVLAEVSTNPQDGRFVGTLLMDQTVNITDGSDPIPYVRWIAYRRILRERILNASGAIRHDGPPDVGFHPILGWPVVAWAYNNGTDRDIAVSEWHGDAWSPPLFLTAGVEDELDPCVFVTDEGGVLVTWWVDGEVPYVMLSRRPRAGMPFSAPVRISPAGEPARRPSVAAQHGHHWVAWEVRPPDPLIQAPRIVVRHFGPDGPLDPPHVVAGRRVRELDPVIHAAYGRVWLDWKHTETEFGWIEFDGAWSETATHPWPDASWLGTESARIEIRRRVMSRPVEIVTPAP